jgi:hypothetical protein
MKKRTWRLTMRQEVLGRIQKSVSGGLRASNLSNKFFCVAHGRDFLRWTVHDLKSCSLHGNASLAGVLFVLEEMPLIHCVVERGKDDMGILSGREVAPALLKRNKLVICSHISFLIK